MSNLQEIQAWFQKQIHTNVELCFDQVRLRKIMVDRWGVCAPVLAIHACCTEGVAAEVSHAFGTPLPIMLKERYVRRLFEKRGLNLQMIHFAVESWAL
ncbi:MAG: hypothetical protein VX278_01275, partial [Myxococcota bacterium]|nr:hypothetical protein [Myxococcota bacterium]